MLFTYIITCYTNICAVKEMSAHSYIIAEIDKILCYMRCDCMLCRHLQKMTNEYGDYFLRIHRYHDGLSVT